MRKLYIVYIIPATCLQNRNDTVYKAKDLYCSEMFVARKEYLNSQQVDWLILSEFHGLIWPDAVLTQYQPKQLSEEEVTLRIDRALSKEIIANTLFSVLELTQPKGVSLSEWRENILNDTQLVLVGDTEFIDLITPKLSLAGVHVSAIPPCEFNILQSA